MKRDPYTDIVPADSFVGLYMDYMRKQETATAYDFWCALWLLTCACSRRVIVDRPRAPVYMNMYLTLVGDSGTPRKSTAIRTCEKLARRLLVTDVTMNVYSSSMSPEKLNEELGELTLEHHCAHVAFAVSELATFLGTQMFMRTMPILLTDLYDCPAKRSGLGNKNTGRVEQRNVFVTFISGSTPVWLLRSVNPNVVEGGYTSRCLFVVSNVPKHKIAWPTPNEDDEQEQNELVAQLVGVSNQAEQIKTITLTTDALRTFTRWYDSRPTARDPYLISFDAREDAHVLRVAGLLCINDGAWVIEKAHVDRAIKLIHAVKMDASEIFQGVSDRGRFVTALNAVRSALLNTGMDPIQRSRLYLRCRKYIDIHEFMLMIDILHEIGAIQRFELQVSGTGPMTEFIRGTKLLLQRGIGERVMERIAA